MECKDDADWSLQDEMFVMMKVDTTAQRDGVKEDMKSCCLPESMHRSRTDGEVKSRWQLDNPSSYLHSILPHLDRRLSPQGSDHSKVHPRTKRYCSFVQNGLNYY